MSDFESEIHRMAAEADRELARTLERAVEAGIGAGVSTAKSTKRYKDHSGSDGLTASIGGKVTSASHLAATGVFEASANHASYVDEGTSAHVIRPRNKTRLRFDVNGQTVFAREVQHPGTKADGFFERGTEAVEKAMNAAADNGLDAVGAILGR